MLNTSTNKSNVVLSEELLSVGLDGIVGDTSRGFGKDRVTKTGTECNLVGGLNSVDLGTGKGVTGFTGSLLCNVVEFMLLELLRRDNIT